MGRVGYQGGTRGDLPFRPHPQSVLRPMPGRYGAGVSPFQVPPALAEHRNTGGVGRHAVRTRRGQVVAAPCQRSPLDPVQRPQWSSRCRALRRDAGGITDSPYRASRRAPCGVPPPPCSGPHRGTHESGVGMEKGLTNRLVLCDGDYEDARTVDNTTVRRYQRRLSRAKKGSRTRAKKRLAPARLWRRETERVRAADYRLAHRLVTDFDGIAVETLNVAGMLRSRRFSKKMSEQRWSALDAILEHKAAKAGVRYVRVNPAYTSTDCSVCGHRQPMPLDTRVYDCGNCGMVLCRDVNAARNICARAYPIRGREGREETSPGVARTNFCQGDRTPPRGGTQADATEQYALSVNSSI